VPGRGVDRSAMRAHTWDISNLGQRVEVIDANVPSRARPRDIEVAAVSISSHIIESAIASNQLNFDDLVRAAVLRVGQVRKRNHNREHYNNEQLMGHGDTSKMSSQTIRRSQKSSFGTEFKFFSKLNVFA
jgi:hypothetical protein